MEWFIYAEVLTLVVLWACVVIPFTMLVKHPPKKKPIKKSSWSLVDWKYAKDKHKKPYLYINRFFGRYSITQDGKK